MFRCKYMVKGLIILVVLLLTTNSTQAVNKALAVVEEGQKVNVEQICSDIGLDVAYATDFPSDMNEFCLVFCSLYPACNPTSAGYIESYVNSGGGVIVTDGAPYFLAGGSINLSSIKHWFGADYYRNDNDTVSVIIDHPLGSSLVTGDSLFQSDTPCNWAAAVSNLQPGATAVAQWHGRCGNNIAAFYYTYGYGKVFYAYSLGHSSMNHVTLLKAAGMWTNSCVPRTHSINQIGLIILIVVVLGLFVYMIRRSSKVNMV